MIMALFRIDPAFTNKYKEVQYRGFDPEQIQLMREHCDTVSQELSGHLLD